MFVFRRGVVEVLGSYDEGCEKYSMSGTRDTFGHGGQLESETLEINECSQERWDLHVRFRHQANDEVLKGGE